MPNELREVDALHWWRLHAHRYPTSHARRETTFPASSVPAERLFSQAGDLITKKRNRILESSSSALLLLKSWLRQPDLEELERLG